MKKRKLLFSVIIIVIVITFLTIIYFIRAGSNLSNLNASKQAKNLFSYIESQKGKKIISGQQDLANAEWVNKKTGKYPAIVGFDLYDYSSASKVSHGEKSFQVEQAIQWSKKGGIVTFCWHWVAPNMKDNVNWPKGFYSKYTDFNVKYALNHPKSQDYKLIINDIDLIAVQLERLQKANVPVLFRPLHEAEGGWFWWGAQGSEYSKKLYILLYKRLTFYHKLNNLIWVWSSTSKKWYPGDKYVDIIGYDYYPKPMDTSPATDKFRKLKEFNKLTALTETGTIPSPKTMRKNGASWSWFMEWRDYLKDGNYNEPNYLKQVYNDPYVITLSDLPKLR